jgi:putative transposase
MKSGPRVVIRYSSRTIAWIDQQRRMSKDYERLCASGEALVYAAMIRLMTRRLART